MTSTEIANTDLQANRAADPTDLINAHRQTKHKHKHKQPQT